MANSNEQNNADSGNNDEDNLPSPVPDGNSVHDASHDGSNYDPNIMNNMMNNVQTIASTIAATIITAPLGAQYNPGPRKIRAKTVYFDGQ